MDFYSFYAAAIAYNNHLNPFQELVTTFASVHNKLPPNLNPPVFITLLSPISYLNVTVASSLWFILSLILGIWGSLICFYILSPKQCFKKQRIGFVLIYLATYANIINTADGQVGHFLLFFIMAGYYFYLKQKDYWAGALWSLIISIKLFPGLLFLFVFVHKRYKVLFAMTFCCLLFGLFSLRTQGIHIYSLYFENLSKITWYNINWNGSIYGYIFRLLVTPVTLQNIVLARTIYYSCFLVLLLWYIKKLNFFKQQETPHTAFCFTLIMMLLLSPLGWVYYFTLLIMPLTFIWYSMKTNPSLAVNILWPCCLLLVNFPSEYTLEQQMEPLMYRISFYSIYFYGLLISLYLVLKAPRQKIYDPSQVIHQEDRQLLTVQCAIGFSLLIIIANLTQSLFA
jgi:hypothetical protein